MFAFAYYKSRNLLAPIALHILLNTLASLSYYALSPNAARDTRVNAAVAYCANNQAASWGKCFGRSMVVHIALQLSGIVVHHNADHRPLHIDVCMCLCVARSGVSNETDTGHRCRS